jgi:hypothetical protein
VENGLAEIYQDDFLDPACSPLTPQASAVPNPEIVAWLQRYAKEQRSGHYLTSIGRLCLTRFRNRAPNIAGASLVLSSSKHAGVLLPFSEP